ncbi:MAG: YgiT-type zinc finger protein [Crocosphaera sp.]|nr:YgiT-type zinc finger protein [Crocosphaera sp.]
MTTCYVCGSTHFTETLVDEMFNINGQYVLVEAIPAKICSQCGEVLFSSETAEKVRLKVNSQSPNKTIPVDVFAY